MGEDAAAAGGGTVFTLVLLRRGGVGGVFVCVCYSVLLYFAVCQFLWSELLVRMAFLLCVRVCVCVCVSGPCCTLVSPFATVCFACRVN